MVARAAEVFQSRHRDCEVQIQEIPLQDRFGLLRSRELDLQLTELPADEPDITTGPVIFTEPRALVIPAGHPFAGRDNVSLEDLAHAPLITIKGPPRYWLDVHFPQHTPTGRPIPQGPATVAWQEVLSLVSAGRGVSPTSARAAQYYARPDLAYVPLRDAPPIEFGLLWLTAAETPKLRAFVKLLLTVGQ
ncbi:LysR family substrate-binding domain-containing protein [Micromonospora arborensis]|uniref:LysR family substrate-binding domain-containing protein n=1 Tax=Micromonospora arborensis TaxID=2116518 RepID=UPI00341036AE